MELARPAPPPLVPPTLPRLLTARSIPDAERIADLEDELVRVRPGLFTTTDPASPVAIAQRDVLLARIAAARAHLDSEYWFSLDSAAALHGLWTYRLSRRVHLTQLYPPQVRREDDSWDHRFHLTRHWTALPLRDRTLVNGVPVTTIERTAADCARLLSLPAALVVMDCALHHRADRELIARIIDESRGKRGVVQARRVLSLADAGSESPGESLTRLAVIDCGLPRPSTQIPVETTLGTKWIDLGWEEPKVGIEFDGEVKYTDLADGDPDAVRRRERERHEAIEAEGWNLVRNAWPDIDAPHGFDVRVRRAIAGRWRLLPDRDD
ncbi:hypothetical protein [Isoptericola sp. NPDC019571]|uniref:type IV toxin-antitoxin system AbiEi family antitoxin domain-containing protein n=1 Tax=Isoptericola sp. NPDC019571 TaxID=3364008 RepID=UPI0037AAE4C4